MPTRAGSQWTDATSARADAPVVARLRAAGAIILGKTVTTEFAGFDPAATRNPWNVSHTAGGSSSGSAAAVAAGMCLPAVGSQTAGSLTRPASYCGVTSCKPTRGRVGTAGIVPVSPLLDHVGPIARCVADLAYMLEAMIDGGGIVDPFVAALRHQQGPRLGLLEDYFFTQADATVVLTTHDTIGLLAESGARVTRRPLPEGFGEVHAMHSRIMAVEAARFHRTGWPAHRTRAGHHLTALVEGGLATSAAAYRAARDHQERFRRAAAAALGGIDALLTPATPTAAPPRLDTTGDPCFNIPWTYSGLPTVSLPSGVTATGLPLALQLIGRPGDEPRLLAIGAWCERQLRLHLSPPILATVSEP
jgi:aspartyl-tRNA(Asn)/glutamyl-tRNA(Gln) amidotransferase subunit A